MPKKKAAVAPAFAGELLPLGTVVPSSSLPVLPSWVSDATPAQPLAVCPLPSALCRLPFAVCPLPSAPGCPWLSLAALLGQ
jgi:hypothetical protein